MSYYCFVKTDFDFANYMLPLDNYEHKQAFSKLRMAYHKLNVESGRCNGIERADRKCKLYNTNQVEDKYQFVIVFDVHRSFRTKYTPVSCK